jgi:hypothetical protein
MDASYSELCTRLKSINLGTFLWTLRTSILNAIDDATRHESFVFPFNAKSASEELTRLFSGHKRPKIAIDKYLGRIVNYLDQYAMETASDDPDAEPTCGHLAIIGGCHFMAQLTSMGLRLEPQNVHRVIMVTALLCHKILEDEPCTNGFYSQVAGVSLPELNRLEFELLKFLDYKAVAQLNEEAMLRVVTRVGEAQKSFRVGGGGGG